MNDAACTAAARSLVVVAFCVALGAGCAEPRASSTTADATARRAAFDSATTAFHQALRTNDANGLFAYVADDVVMMPPGETPVRGKAAMRDWYAAFLSQYRTSSLTLTNRDLFVSDAWAVELGGYEWGLTPAAGGDVVVDRGNYMQVWKIKPDGGWQFYREIWNSAAPASSPPQDSASQ